MNLTCDDSGETKDLAGASKSYQHVLVIVVVLNLAMGLAEMSGGFVGLSQALKADALDFFGDGLITLLGLLAVSRGQRWRARAALLQGVFLAVLGLGVIAAAVYRLVERAQPEPAVMGVLGFLALATNVVCAVLLVPHRQGDANVRALWLFSRNDALGNVAVILAGGLVYWSGAAWPDLVAATAIAALFLTSAIQILKSASRELQVH